MLSEDDGCTIAVDAMGGDNSPKAVVDAIILSHRKYPRVSFVLYGDQRLVSEYLDLSAIDSDRISVIHTEKSIPPHEKPSIAVRSGRGSSMWLAIEAVKNGAADAVISSGNTGALMGIAKLQLRTLSSIDRPAICTLIPHLLGHSVMLDLGANIECDAENLLQFAIMGNAYAKIILGIERPTIGLLNVGSEIIKGNSVIKEAFNLLLEQELNFCGYIEGDDLAGGKADVIVTDGFTGNIALKTAEGTASLCKKFMAESFNQSIFAKLGYFFARNSLKKTFSKFDSRLYNGAMLIGLNGVVIKSHGSADEVAFASAISSTIELVRKRVNHQITELLGR